jgi:hypothetical protein
LESSADLPAGGGDKADLFAGTPFKTTGWAGQEKHRQDYQWRGEKREKEGTPKTHPPMGAAKCRKQAGDDVGENGCCHDLTATNELSRVYWPGLPDQVPSMSLTAAKLAQRFAALASATK